MTAVAGDTTLMTDDSDSAGDGKRREGRRRDGGDVTESGLQARVDAADRLERVIDTQISTLNEIDTKAEHVTRLVAVLLGVVLSVLSLAARQSTITVTDAAFSAVLTFVAGIVALLSSMTAAVVTYLGSRFKTGLHQNVGYLLSNAEYTTDVESHVRRVLGNYGYTVEKNKQVLTTNARRFRLTLLLLLVGVLYVSLSAFLSLGAVSVRSGRVLVVVSLVVVLGLSWYVLGGKYLTLEGEER